MTHLRKPLLAGILGMALALAACSSGGSGQSGESGGTASNSGAATLRRGDEGAAGAYEESLAAFHEQNPDIAVEISVVPWSDYFTKLRTDIAAGSMDDLFWINNSSYTSYAKSGNMVNIDAPKRATSGMPMLSRPSPSMTHCGACRSCRTLELRCTTTRLSSMKLA